MLRVKVILLSILMMFSSVIVRGHTIEAFSEESGVVPFARYEYSRNGMLVFCAKINPIEGVNSDAELLEKISENLNNKKYSSVKFVNSEEAKNGYEQMPSDDLTEKPDDIDKAKEYAIAWFHNSVKCAIEEYQRSETDES